MVYNFSLPPLVLHSIQTGTTRKLKDWASSLDLPTTEVTFFNFLASHDGIGLLPARGILSDEEIDSLANHALARGGRVSYKNDPDGSTSPYEMNINYLEATRPSGGEETVEQTARRFLATQSVLLALRGVPGIYYHSLLGSENWVEGMLTTGQNRTINREKLRYPELMADLANPDTLRYHVFNGYQALLAVRRAERAFDPHGEQVVLNTPDSIFGLYRRGRKMEQGVFCLANFTNLPVTVSMEPGLFENASREYIDLLSDTHHLLSEGCLSLYLSPYQVIWLKAF
jgi:sucrose phosphorylase